MAIREIIIDVDFAKKDILKKFSIKQFDNATITINTFFNEALYNPIGNTCKLFIGIDDDLFLQESNIQVQENKIIIELDRNMISKSGMAYAELELKDSNGVMTSITFIFYVEKKIGEGATIPGNIEGFVAKYERLIAEFKANVDSTVKNCNDRIDNKLDQLQADYNTTKNEVVKKTDDKIVEVENRFNELTAKQQQDSEVIDARDGEVSLPARLDRDKQELSTRISGIDEVVAYDYSSENNYISIKNTKEGTLDNVRVEGNTIINYIEGNPTVTLVPTSRAKTINLVYPIQGGSTIYLRLNVIHKTNVPKGLGIQFLHGDGTYTVGVITGIYNQKISVKVEKEVKALYFYISQSDAEENENAKHMFKDLYVTTSDISQYFEGIKSVGELEELEITSRKEDGNLFDYANIDGVSLVDNGILIEDKTYDLLPLLTNVKYEPPLVFSYNIETISGTLDKSASLFILKYEDGSGSYIIPTQTKTTITKTLKSILLVNWCRGKNKITNIQLEKGTQVTNHKDFKSDKKKAIYKDVDGTWKPVILREWDYIEELADGRCKYHRVGKQVVFNGVFEGEWILSETQTNTIRFAVTPSDRKLHTPVICDKFKYVDGTPDEESITSGNSIAITIPKSKLSTQDIVGFKAWLKDNNVTVVYQLKEEEIFDCIDLSLNSFNNETSVFTNSSIPHKLTVTQKQGLKARVETLEQEMKFLYDNFNYALKQILAGNTQELAYILYPQDFTDCNNDNNTDEDIPVTIPNLK